MTDTFSHFQSAYEIATFWGEEPPPREILEDISAKGGDLRTRTLENYSVPNYRAAIDPAMADGGGANADSGEDDIQVTPKREKTEPEEQGSASRYPTRMFWR